MQKKYTGVNCFEILKFTNDASIELDYSKAKCYMQSTHCDNNALNQGFIWHQIIINHGGKLVGPSGKSAIQNALFDVVKDEEFYPIAYQQKERYDKCLIRQCTAALKLFFNEGLCVTTENSIKLFLEVNLNVGEYKLGQISPHSKIEAAINSLYRTMEEAKAKSRAVLDLSCFANDEAFADVIIDLSNGGVMRRVLTFISRHDLFRCVKVLILRANGIRTLAPLEIFHEHHFTTIDLRDNKLSNMQNLQNDLKKIRADKVLLSDNPIVEEWKHSKNANEFIQLFPCIDFGLETISKEVDVRNELFRLTVDPNNRKEIKKFAKCSSWHAVMIPDIAHAFTKDDILDYFLNTVSTGRSDIYPCYYKYAAGKHQFLVRNCYDQLLYLADECNFKLKMPSSRVPDSGDSVFFNFVMNFSNFKNGQVEPLAIIQNILQKRYNCSGTQLTLNQFQNAKGLENIYVSLRPPKMLNQILKCAAKLFSKYCTKLCLSNNNIELINASALCKFPNVISLDLSDNNIERIINLKGLSVMCQVKSLILNGNPLCGKYQHCQDYIKDIVKILPSLTKLDNVTLPSIGDTLKFQNYLANFQYYDLVNQFIKQYFILFDAKSRSDLKYMYHQDAMLTLKINCKKDDDMQNAVKRNNTKDVDISPAAIHVGSQAIIEALSRLPRTKHDLYSFTTDAPICKDNMIIMTVNGVFWHLNDLPSKKNVLLAFTRTYVIAIKMQNHNFVRPMMQYEITNDQWYIYDASSSDEDIANVRSNRDLKESKPYILKNSDKNQLAVLLQDATNLKMNWCQRYLIDNEWNFHKSIDSFIKDATEKSVPKGAYI